MNFHMANSLHVELFAYRGLARPKSREKASEDHRDRVGLAINGATQQSAAANTKLQRSICLSRVPERDDAPAPFSSST